MEVNAAPRDTGNDVASPLTTLVYSVIKEQLGKDAAAVVARIVSSFNPEQTLNMMTLLSSLNTEQVRSMKTLISSLTQEKIETMKTLISSFTSEQTDIVMTIFVKDKENQSSSEEQLGKPDKCSTTVAVCLRVLLVQTTPHVKTTWDSMWHKLWRPLSLTSLRTDQVPQSNQKLHPERTSNHSLISVPAFVNLARTFFRKSNSVQIGMSHKNRQKTPSPIVKHRSHSLTSVPFVILSTLSLIRTTQRIRMNRTMTITWTIRTWTEKYNNEWFIAVSHLHTP